MRKVFVASLFILAFTLLMMDSALAQSDLKIAVVDIRMIVNTSKYGQEVMEKLQKKYEELQAKLEARARELDALREEIEKKGPLWSQEVREKKQQEFQRKLREFRTMQEDAQFEMQELERKLLDPVFKELEKVIRDYVQREKIDLLLEKNQPGIYYVSPRIDISSKVIELFDNYYETTKRKKETPASKPAETKEKTK
jgi:outer membrane protein